eukprot:TRINITY_DN3525_c0_g1_i2.p1 TRINITY_DN3525_c0_g1~~TRINITY_DN3525_c0_g1_i2.p1  ORF type:complete len:254 (-),score=12.90 TRINITY_DN3525_c0_g1_i2:35-796(-)
MRNASVDAIIAAQKETMVVPLPLSVWDDIPWEPTYDGYLVPTRKTLTAISNGQINTVKSVLLGTNKNETAGTVYEALTQPLSPLLYEELINLIEGPEKGAELLALYPPPSGLHADARPQLTALSTDAASLCPTRQALRFLTNLSVPTFGYLFKYTPTTDPFNANNTGCSIPGSVCHSAELQFVFRSGTFTPGMVALWTSFATQGVPVSPALPTWPLYDSSDPLLGLDLPSSAVVHRYQAAQCDWWDVNPLPLP